MGNDIMSFISLLKFWRGMAGGQRSKVAMFAGSRAVSGLKQYIILQIIL